MSELDRKQVPEPGPVRPFGFPDVLWDELPNGLSVLAAHHGELPIVTAGMLLDAGGSRDPDGAGGLARLTSLSLETGTGELSADDVAWELERIGIELHAGVNWDTAIVSLTVPSERLEPALEVFSALVRAPSFPAEEVDRLRDEQLADLLQRRKEPRALASDMAARFIFGEGVPYARPLAGLPDEVRRLDRAAVEAFHRTHYAPSAGALLLVGDFPAEHGAHLASHHFGDWSGESPAWRPVEVRPRVETTTVFIIERPEAVQSEIRIGHVGIERTHPDYFPVLVLNTLLGGAFTSRLNMSLREKHGFTYGAHSSFECRRSPGPFLVQAAVGTEVTARAVEEALHVMQELHDDGPADDEVRSSRDYLRGIMPLRLQTTGDLASRLGDLITYHLPADYFSHYRERIAAVSTDDVARVAREHLNMDALAIVVVGDAAKIETPLRELGVGAVEVHAAE
jgi:zinc protease